MNPKIFTKFRLRSTPVEKGSGNNKIPLSRLITPSDPITSSLLKLKKKTIGEWNPFELIKCVICWKPIDIYGKDAHTYMECPHCHQKAHQDHMLRWLAKHHTCPYCRGKM
ncbi:MAG: E3 ubiquitin protein ligase [Candidatus Heimdallarchaeota archaeon]|nr:MAG: E3 ubiquitin protein ligase [Candidatus Heimdallarchaeota archaeon]